MGPLGHIYWEDYGAKGERICPVGEGNCGQFGLKFKNRQEENNIETGYALKIKPSQDKSSSEDPDLIGEPPISSLGILGMSWWKSESSFPPEHSRR